VGYEVQQSINGAAFTTIAQPTGTTINVTLSNSSKTYRYRGRDAGRSGSS
jgi:hypothetical protein